MHLPFRKTVVILFFISPLFCFSQDDGSYQTPPKDITDLVLARPTPGVLIDSKGQWMILMDRSDFPTVEDLAQPELRIAGLRINPRNFGPSRGAYSMGFQLKHIPSKKLHSISGLPENLKANNIQWSPDEQKFSFTNISNNRIDLYEVDLNSRTARKINTAPLNAVLGGAYWWAGPDRLVYKTVPANNRPYPEPPLAPKGPIVQENLGKKAASRTYQDLIRSPYDEELFDYMATAQLAVNENGNEKLIGSPAIYRSIEVSPDKKYLLSQVIIRPFSYLVTANGFPTQISVMDMEGKLVRSLAKNPSSEGQPIGFDDTYTYPRFFGWKADEPSTVIYVQALDKGLGRSKSEYRDALMAVKIPGSAEPESLFKTKRRFQGIAWGQPDLAIFSEGSYADRKVRMNRFNPLTGAVDSLYERSSDDSYGDIGEPVKKKNQWGKEVLLVRKDGNLLLDASGAGPKGDLPLLQTWNLKTGARKIIWQSEEGYYEYPVYVLDGDKPVFITRRESPSLTPNYTLRDGSKKNAAPVALTDFPNPYKQLEGVVKQKISYQRTDGINLTGDLYLPKNYDAKKDGALPVIIWAYPIEYKSANDAAQVRGSKFTFTRINYGSPVFWVTQGYAVLDNAEMPIVGEGDKEPNDHFIPQLYLNAHAAIKKLAEMGVGDSNRVAVGGHSYGAFMTANLLAHTKLFKAGIARSGAYNRTLTPFGFQAEERTYWEAPEVYNNMSPFMHAHKIKTPLLLIHGEMDNNSGTFPIQSERLYNAVKGHGGTARFVVLPYESHGYAARENILHMLWEQNQWLDKWVKNADKNKVEVDKGKAF
jgi:dipeptidyl aminopeptidase/acylaminoacyl peptidase